MSYTPYIVNDNCHNCDARCDRTWSEIKNYITRPNGENGSSGGMNISHKITCNACGFETEEYTDLVDAKKEWNFDSTSKVQVMG